jgi:hypothetical protein
VSSVGAEFAFLLVRFYYDSLSHKYTVFCSHFYDVRKSNIESIQADNDIIVLTSKGEAASGRIYKQGNPSHNLTGFA